MDSEFEVRFEGCDDPGAFLDKREAEWRARMASVVMQKPYSQQVDELAERAAKEGWTPFVSDFGGSFEEYRQQVHDSEAKARQAASMRDRLEALPIRAALAVMPGARMSGPQADAVVAGFVDRLEKDLHVELAEDYKTYLSACGRLSIGKIDVAGIDPSGEMDLFDGVKDAREAFGIPDRYYPLSAIDSARTNVICFFQDVSGYVYGLDEEGLFRPAYRSLAAYLAAMWYRVEEGLI